MRGIWLLAWVTVARLLVALILRLLPYRCWQPLLAAAMTDRSSETDGDAAAVRRIVQAVAETERILPAGRCLERAFTAWLLLYRRAPCTIRLGATIDGQGQLFAHAWLEFRGEVVLGRPIDPLSPLDPPPHPERHT